MEKLATNNTKTADSAEHSNCYYLALGILIGLIVALCVILASTLFFPRVSKEFQQPNFRLVSTSSSPFSMSSGSFPFSISNNPDSWNLTFLIKNPNDNYIFFYDDLEADITYNGAVFWHANVSGNSYQEKKAQSFINATFGALSETDSNWIVYSFAHDIASGHSTKFSVKLNGKVQINHHKAHCGVRCEKVRVSCEGLGIQLSEDAKTGILGVTSNVCEVHLEKTNC